MTAHPDTLFRAWTEQSGRRFARLASARKKTKIGSPFAEVVGPSIFVLVILVLVGVLGTSTLTTSIRSGPHLHSVLDDPVAPSVQPLSAIPPSADWPTYLYNAERTGANVAERTISPANVSQLQELWSVPSNGSDFSSPIVVNGSVYFGSWNGYEYSVDAATGRVEWQTFLGTDDCGDGSPQGISSTPAYVNGTLYLGGGGGSASGTNTYWYALNATSGSVDWKYLEDNNTTNVYNWASALVYHNSLYIGIASCADNPLVPGEFREVNLTGNHTASHVFYTSPPGDIGESIWSTPTLDPGSNVVWVTTGNEDPSEGYPPFANAVIALNATTLSPIGSWQVPNVEGQDSDFGTTATLLTTPLGVQEVAATNKNGFVYAFDRSNVSSNGSWGPVWSTYTGGAIASGAYDGRTLYLGGWMDDHSEVYGLDPDNGNISWMTTIPTGYILGGLTWANGIVYVAGGSEIYAVDSNNGTILWNCTAPGGESIGAEPVVADGRLYVASGDFGTHGNLTAFGIPLSVTATTSTFNGTAPLPVDLFAAAQGGMPPYVYAWQFGDGNSSNGSSPVHTYSEGGTYPARVTVTDAANDSADALLLIRVKATYALTFTATGLRSGTEWWVNLTNGQSYNSTTATISFDEPNGTYNYAVSSGNNSYTAAGGFFHVDGAGVFEIVAFDLVKYPITFIASGLPSGTSWSVTLNDGTQTSTTSEITFTEPNGTYSYVVGDVRGWHQSTLPYTGLVTVSGSTVIGLDLEFARVTYWVTFTEEGLPATTGWWVNTTGGLTAFSTGTTLSFAAPNGTYLYTVATTNEKYSSPGGYFWTNGAALSEVVSFVGVTYTVTFSEDGLPAGTAWFVNITGGPSYRPAGNTLDFSETNGTYSYVVATVDKEYAPGSTTGSFEVGGASVSESVTFHSMTYLVAFTETGLPTGMNWSVSLTGNTTDIILAAPAGDGSVTLTLSSDGISIVQFDVSNGSYSYSASSPGLPKVAGNVTVHGLANATVAVDFLSTSASSAGFPTFDFVFGTVGAAGAAGLIAVFMVRRRKVPPISSTPPSQPH